MGRSHSRKVLARRSGEAGKRQHLLLRLVLRLTGNHERVAARQRRYERQRRRHVRRWRGGSLRCCAGVATGPCSGPNAGSGGGGGGGARA